MISLEALKLELVQNILSLPDDLLPQVRGFLDDLANDNGTVAANGAKRSKAGKGKKGGSSRQAKHKGNYDPMLKFIGLASYEPPAKSIDEELYGDRDETLR